MSASFETFNEGVPYVMGIDRGFLPPKKIRVVAIPAQTAQSFYINLKADNETFLHFNARFNEMVVVRNNTRYGAWSKSEEREGGFPFIAGMVFTIELEATFNSVKVKVNGNDFCEFEHRDNFRSVNGLEIGGDIEFLHSVGISE